ncbi:MAG: tyrosine-type recombinase/integrase [Acidobacteriota bacterium]
MPRTSNNPRIVNRTVRAKLAERRDPHWHLIAEGQHLGYRRQDIGGTWIARYYTREHGRRFQALGSADDTAPANGTHVLSFQQALEAAQAWFATLNRADAAGVHIGKYTVKDAAKDWLDTWDGSERSKQTSQANVDHHIVPVLGSIEVAKLTRRQVEQWLHALADKKPLKVIRREQATKKLSPSRRSMIVYKHDDPETKRRRKDSANRVFNDLRALLTRAYDNQHVSSKAPWDTVSKFENVDKPKVEYLTPDEAQRFMSACPLDFRNLVQAALITGCRYGELCGLRASAFHAGEKTISLVQSKTGKRKWIVLTDDEATFFAGLCEGKQTSDLLLRRADGEEWNKSNQQVRMRSVLRAAKITRAVRFHDLRHTFASLLVQNGASLQLVANQLGHSGTAMANKHYAHLSPEYIGKTVRAIKPSMTYTEASA